MKPGKLALLRFPQVNLEEGKLRPVLLIARVPGDYPDWFGGNGFKSAGASNPRV